MDLELRAITEEEFEAWDRAMASGFGGDHHDEDRDRWRAIVELERTMATFDRGSIVSTGGAFSYDLTVPGGVAQAAGVTAISVLPTHRRRGILTAMMRRQLDDVHERGEPLAILWASESVIYGRFGYGVAADQLGFELSRSHAIFREQSEPKGSVRLLERQEALELFPPVYDRVRDARPGFYQRTPQWWESHSLHDPERHRKGFSSNRLAVYEEEGDPAGYVRYRFKHEWPEGIASGRLRVTELMWTSLDSYRALWSFVFGVDLVGTVEAYLRPVDEPLRWMLADPRRLIRKPSDGLWVRVVDVPAALERRAYRLPARVVFEFHDAFCPWNAGTYELEADGDGATCRRTDRAPELTLGAAELGAIYLGGGTLDEFRQAGLVEGDEQAIRSMDLLFGWSPSPWCPEIF